MILVPAHCGALCRGAQARPDTPRRTPTPAPGSAAGFEARPAMI
jgi:hypothetical protein